MSWRETVLSFSCKDASLLGVLSAPTGEASGLGLIIVVGGPQYRVGSHRQFVLLARALASQGRRVLRFDCRGMGDGEGAASNFENFSADIGAAVAALRGNGAQRVVLWGLCDAASAILLHLDEQGAQAGVDGIVLLNPWVRSAASLARTHVKHYYLQRLMQREFWLKLLRGGVAGKALGDLFGNLRSARKSTASAGSFQQRMARAWRAFPGPVLLLLSGQDYVAKEFLDHCNATPDSVGLLSLPGVMRADLLEADHTFSTAAWRAEVETLTGNWLQARFPS